MNLLKLILLWTLASISLATASTNQTLEISTALFSDPENVEVYKLSPTIDTNSATGFLVPKDLEECFIELNTMLTPDFIDEIKGLEIEKQTYRYWLGFGSWLRSHWGLRWGLWERSELVHWFWGKGIENPERMFGFIMVSYWRHLNDMPILLEDQIRQELTFGPKYQERCVAEFVDKFGTHNFKTVKGYYGYQRGIRSGLFGTPEAAIVYVGKRGSGHPSRFEVATRTGEVISEENDIYCGTNGIPHLNAQEILQSEKIAEMVWMYHVMSILHRENGIIEIHLHDSKHTSLTRLPPGMKPEEYFTRELPSDRRRRSVGNWFWLEHIDNE